MFKCPKCRNPLQIKRISLNAGYLVVCKHCRKHLMTSLDVKTEKEAYNEFVAMMLRAQRKEKLKRENKLEKIRKLVSSQGLKLGELPSLIKEVFLSPDCEVVTYKFFRSGEIKLGSKVEETNLDRDLVKGLKESGIEHFFKFQEEALNKVIEGSNVVIVAPTGTGKTEAFTVPILQLIRQGSNSPGVKALFIYPTKSLARDQLRKIKFLSKHVGVEVGIFDGDTPYRKRKEIINSPPDIVITNFDVLNYHLMNQTSFFQILKTVKYVVIDEIHTYTGAFGSNVYFILKRMKRFTGNLKFICSSATIANPKEFVEALIEDEVEVIGEPSGRRGNLHVLILFPQKVSSTTLIVSLAKKLSRKDYKFLVFTNSHLFAEILNKAIRRAKVKVNIHRAGLPKKHRREVEKKFLTGELNAIVSTPTLELGIDIGNLQAVISTPIGFTRFLQRIGRAARKEGQEGVAFLVLKDNDQISLYYHERPDDFFKDIDPAYVEPKNPVVAKHQLLAACLDKPLSKDEVEKEFSEFRQVLNQLIKNKLVSKIGGRFYPEFVKARKILSRYSIRGIGEKVYIFYGKKTIGEREMPLAMRELFPGAVYLHGGKIYVSRKFSFTKGTGRSEVDKLSPDYPYYTIAKRYTLPSVIKVIEKRKVWNTEVSYCDLKVSEIVEGYFIKEINTQKTILEKGLEKPLVYTYKTKGLFFKAPQPGRKIEEILSRGYWKEEYGDIFSGVFHAVEHVLIESSNMLTGGGSKEMGGVSLGDTGYIVVYDGCVGGNGLTKLLYDKIEEAFKRSLFILEKCSCKRVDGCPKCTYSYQCGNNNKPLFKLGAVESLREILSGGKVVCEETLPKISKSYA